MRIVTPANKAKCKKCLQFKDAFRDGLCKTCYQARQAFKKKGTLKDTVECRKCNRR